MWHGKLRHGQGEEQKRCAASNAIPELAGRGEKLPIGKLGNVVRAVVRLHQPSISYPSLTADACVVQITPFTASLSTLW